MLAPAEDNAHAQPAERRRARWYLAGYWLFLLVLTHWPNPWAAGGEPHHLDKLVHFALYFVLAGLAAGALTTPNGPTTLRRTLGVLLLAIVFGLIDETTQPLTQRDFDWWDWLADALGAATGVMTLIVWRCRHAGQNAMPTAD